MTNPRVTLSTIREIEKTIIMIADTRLIQYILAYSPNDSNPLIDIALLI